MKRLFLIASVATLAFVACDSTQPAQAVENQESVATAPSGDVAYVRSESVIAGSEIYLTEGVALRTKTEKAQESWTKKEQGFQYEANQLQEKYQKGLITSADAQKQQTSIENRVKSFQTNTQKEMQALEEENYVFNNRIQDLFRRAVQQLNSNKDYKMILDASLVIDADTTLDLSDQILGIVNELYAAEKTETK